MIMEKKETPDQEKSRLMHYMMESNAQLMRETESLTKRNKELDRENVELRIKWHEQAKKYLELLENG